MTSAVPALKSGSLVRVLPDHQLQKVTAYVLYPSRQYLGAKIGTSVEFLREVVPEALAADKGRYCKLSRSVANPMYDRFRTTDLYHQYERRLRCSAAVIHSCTCMIGRRAPSTRF